MEENECAEKGNYVIIIKEIDDIGLESVYESYNKLNNQKFLCKLIKTKELKNKKINLEDLDETIKIHSQIKNDNIDNLVECIKGKTNLYLFFDYMEGQTLLSYKKEGKNFKEKEIYLILDKVMNAILYLYNNKIILNDLKLENLFFTEDNKILLCNLERRNLLAKSKKESKFKNSYKKISVKIGTIICKLLDYDNLTKFLRQNKNKKLQESRFDLIQEYFNKYILKNDNISKQLINLIGELLQDDNNRIKIEDIKSHEWFLLFSGKEINQSQISDKKSKAEIKSSIDTSYISNTSTIKESINQNIINNKAKEVKEETIITDEPYLEYYKKEREVLLGLRDSFDKDEIYNNLKLSEKYFEEQAKSKVEKKSTLVNFDNNITYEDNSSENIINIKRKKEKKGILGFFSCH